MFVSTHIHMHAVSKVNKHSKIEATQLKTTRNEISQICIQYRAESAPGRTGSQTRHTLICRVSRSLVYSYNA